MTLTLWRPSFILWLLGTAQSQFGGALVSLAFSFLVLQQTGSAGNMAITLACSLLPQVFGPFAGAWIDRLELKVPLIGADLTRGVVQLVLGGLTPEGESAPFWVINGAAVLMGVANVFAVPATQAAVPRLSPEQELPRANGLVVSVSQGAGLLGSLAGGVIVARTSPAAAMLLAGGSFLVMTLLLLFVQFRKADIHQPQQRPALLHEVMEGLRFMHRSPLLTWTPVLALFLNAATVLITVLLPKIMQGLGVGAQGYGTYSALMGGGVVVAGLLVAAVGQRLPLASVTGCGFFLLTAAFGLMALKPEYGWLLTGGALAGVASGCINTPLFTLIQQQVPQALLGRVFSVLVTGATLGMPLSLFGLAPVLDRFPSHMWLGFDAVILLLCSLGWVALVGRGRPPLPSQSEA